MTDEELLALNRKGWIPGPRESEDHFLQRIAQGQMMEQLPRAHTEWVREQLREIYDFEPESLAICYSNRQLAPWQGAACWIDANGASRLQLREGFRSGTYLKIYGRDEVVAHEAVHAARAAFDEPEFEEFFAYASGPNKWRRVLGPIIRRPWEAWAAMGSICATLFFEPIGFFASLFIGVGFYRLIRQHRTLKKAAAALPGDPKKIRAILFRMTDREIRKLSRGEPVEGDDTLRWRLIRRAYYPEQI